MPSLSTTGSGSAGAVNASASHGAVPAHWNDDEAVIELGRLGVSLARSRSLKACQFVVFVALFELF